MALRAVSIVALCAAAYGASPVFRQDFEQDSSGWHSAGPDSARISITHDAAHVKSGKSALEFHYQASFQEPAAALLPAPEALAAMKSMRFWIRAEDATAAAVVLREDQGGRYLANFWLEAGKWQNVALSPGDFVLAEGAGDPPDPNHHLDLGQVKNISILDVSQILNPELAQAEGPVYVTPHAGPETIDLDDFELSPEALPDTAASGSSHTGIALAEFDHPQADWITFGGAHLAMEDQSLTVSYQRQEDRFPVILRRLPKLDLQGVTRLELDVASEKPAHLTVILEGEAPGHDRGPRFRADLDLPGDGKFTARSLPFSDFQPSDEGDSGAKLDVSNIRSIGLLDIYGAFTQTVSDNRLRLRGLRALKEITAPAAQKQSPGGR